jgi:hypothetical protein
MISSSERGFAGGRDVTGRVRRPLGVGMGAVRCCVVAAIGEKPFGPNLGPTTLLVKLLFKNLFERTIMVKNPVAKDVRSPKYRPRVVRPKKGRGARPTRRADALLVGKLKRGHEISNRGL